MDGQLIGGWMGEWLDGWKEEEQREGRIEIDEWVDG